MHVHKSAFYLAVEKENIELIRLLLGHDNLDINFINRISQTLVSNKIRNLSVWMKFSILNILMSFQFFLFLNKVSIRYFDKINDQTFQ